MRRTKHFIIDCSALGQAIKDGTAMPPQLTANIGIEHAHWIYFIKVKAGTDPTQVFKPDPSSGTHFFKIRPNEFDRKPSREHGKSWDWYLLTCPHDPPCPDM
jgi:hypothetical protein